MNLLTDEILNEYLDGNLDEHKAIEVEKLLATSENDQKTI